MPGESLWGWLPLLAILVLAGALFAWAHSPVPIDDAPITWRYAENLAAGRGMVYNEGERVQGTSTPLWTLLLAGVSLAGLKVPLASQILSMSASLLAVIVYYALARTILSWRTSVWVALFVVTIGLLASQASWGMETGFYVLLIGLSFLLYATKRYTLATVAAAACLLTRLDGLLVGMVILAGLAAERKRVPWKCLAIYLAVVLPWVLTAQRYYGSFLPQSMVAKMAHPAVAGRFWLLGALLSPPLCWFVPFAVLGSAALLSGYARSWKAKLFLAWIMLYIAAFTLFPLDPYPWYFTPLVTGLGVVIGVGVERLLDWLMQSVAIGPRVRRVAEVLFLALLLCLSAFEGLEAIAYWHDYLSTVEAQRVEIARWLRENTPRESAIATAGIGHIGYYSQRRVVDLGGLVTPRGRLYAQDGWEDLKPDYLLFTLGGGHAAWNWTGFRPALMYLPWGAEPPERCYELVTTWPRVAPAGVEAGGTYYLYRRRDVCR